MKTQGMGQQCLAQHKQDCISLSGVVSSPAAQILADLKERKRKKKKKSPNYCIWGRGKPDDLAAIRQVYNISPATLSHH